MSIDVPNRRWASSLVAALRSGTRSRRRIAASGAEVDRLVVAATGASEIVTHPGYAPVPPGDSRAEGSLRSEGGQAAKRRGSPDRLVRYPVRYAAASFAVLPGGRGCGWTTALIDGSVRMVDAGRPGPGALPMGRSGSACALGHRIERSMAAAAGTVRLVLVECAGPTCERAWSVSDCGHERWVGNPWFTVGA